MLGRIPKEEAVNRLQSQLKWLGQLLAGNRDHNSIILWRFSTKKALQDVFGSGSRHLSEFERIRFAPMSPDVSGFDAHDTQLAVSGALVRARFVLEAAVKQIEHDYPSKSSAPKDALSGEPISDPFAILDDQAFAQVAIAEARKSSPEDDRPHPRVGVVVVKNGVILAKAHRGEVPHCHAEYIALKKKTAQYFTRRRNGVHEFGTLHVPQSPQGSMRHSSD